jgi:HEAT repeat protein
MGLMPTLTSQEPPPKPELTPADALAAIGRGDFTSHELIPLADLGRADLANFRRAWSAFPVESRERVVRTFAEIAENDVRYQFGRALRVALDDPSDAIRQRAIAALWEDEGLDLLEALLELVERDPSQDVRAEAAQGLGRFTELAAAEELDDEAADRLRDVLISLGDDPDSPYIVRRRALESVAVFGADPDIVDLIRNAYDADDAGMKAAALYAMGRSLDVGWVETIVYELESDDAELRYEAARAAGEIGDHRAVLGLIDLASDEDAEVRQAAIVSLGKVGGTAAVQALRRLAKVANPIDAEAIEEALDEALLAGDTTRMRS